MTEKIETTTISVFKKDMDTFLKRKSKKEYEAGRTYTNATFFEVLLGEINEKKP